MEIVARSVAWFGIVGGLPPSLLLFVVAETARGRVLGAAGLLAVAALFSATTRWRRIAIAPAVVAVAGVLGLAWTIPRNAPSPGFEGTPIEASVWQLVPEVDLVKLGIAVAVWIDPHVDRAQARRIADVALPIYAEIPDHPRTALAFAFGEVFGSVRDGHRYWSTPRQEGAPVLIFLHGSAGNFASYARVSSALDAVVVCPSVGFGLYLNSERTAAVVEDARRFAVETLGGDPERVFVAALSQGGVGGMEVARGAEWVRGLILISAVMEPHLAEGWTGPEVFVMHGEADRRIPVEEIRARVATMARTATVSATYFEGEDHFLMFSRRSEVVEAIASFIDRGGEEGDGDADPAMDPEASGTADREVDVGGDREDPEAGSDPDAELDR